MADIFDFYVLDNRKINFEIAEPIMREDKGVTDWVFHIPKILNGIDMSTWAWWLVYTNAKNQKHKEALVLSDDPESPLDSSVGTYTVDYGMSIKAGSVQFALEAINAVVPGGEISGEWHTLTYKTTVKETLQGSEVEIEESQSDIISALIQQIQQKYNALVGGATPLPVNLKSQMTDHDKVYLYTGSEDGEQTGYWYYYNGTQFVPGGLYAAGIQIDPTLSQSGHAADAKVVGDKIDELKNDLNFQTNTERIASFVNQACIKTNINVGSVVDLTPVASTAYSYSINECSTGDIFVINGMGGGAPRLWAFIDDDNKLLSVSTAALAGNDLVIIAPNKAKKIIINSETRYLGTCYRGYLSKRISIVEDRTYDLKKAYPIPEASKLIKELYIQDLKGYTVYKVDVFMGALASSTGLYFSEVRLSFNNTSNRFIRICLQSGHATPEQAIASINYYNNKVYEFNDLVINGTNDTISGYIIFDVSEENPGQTEYANITVNDLSNSYYSPTIANALTTETVNIRTVCSAVNNAINGENTYQAEDDFKDLENVNVFKNGVLVSPSLYTLYPHGKVQFVSGTVNQGDELRFEYNKFQKSYPDFSNDFSTALYGMGVYEENGSNMWGFTDDPAGVAGKVLKISRNTQVTGNLIRCQLYRDVSYTEFYHEVKAYFTKELLDAIISYPDYVHWFALSSDWSPYGSVTGSTTNLYSGSSNWVQLYKTNAEDNKVHYNIINRKREVIGGVESYETIAFNVSDFEVLADEWITLRLHVKVGNPGIFELTVIDSNGTHTLNPMRRGNETAYVGLADPENEAELYGSNVSPVIPTRKVYETMFAKLYTSADIANHIINENGEVAIYFKDYKEYNCVNVNAF